MTAIVETEKLTKYYGSHRGIIDVDLQVAEGEAFGFLGPNGAGKTTTIRTLLDHLRPTSGRARIFGIETTANPVAIHRRIGYLPGEFTLYDRLTGAQSIEYFGNLRGSVDPAYRASIIERLDVDPSRKFREYSKGNKQKIGLVTALQHRPELLIGRRQHGHPQSLAVAAMPDSSVRKARAIATRGRPGNRRDERYRALHGSSRPRGAA
ncbi:MAG TPA: ABC transporter ATP-binding protein [Actinomycetes bacterium]|jgi:ABC-2 type transport system ATP-binding protein|nr:ABC transporter ATP-binding protein [Actinomycetes bacterium]